MNVQELIDELSKIEDKTLIVMVTDTDSTGCTSYEPVIEVETNYSFNTKKPTYVHLAVW